MRQRKRPLCSVGSLARGPCAYAVLASVRLPPDLPSDSERVLGGVRQNLASQLPAITRLPTGASGMRVNGLRSDRIREP